MNEYRECGLVFYCMGNHKPRDAHAGVWGIFLVFLAYVFARAQSDPRITNIKVIITSIYRPDGTHSTRDCIDVDLFVNGKSSELTGVGKELMITAKGFIETMFPYGIGFDGKAHHTFVWDTDVLHRGHLHLQCPIKTRGDQWKTFS